LARLIKACFTVQCTHTVDTASRREAEFVAWREEWRATVGDRLPPAACVSVGGLGNALQFECSEYTTAFKKHLRQGIAALHARALRAADGLSKRDAETATERRLCGSPYFSLREARVFHHNAVADPEAPTITNHHEALLVLVGCLRAVDAAGGKNFHLAPLVGPGRRFLFLDRRQLQYTYTQHPELLAAGHALPTCVADVVAIASPRKGYELGASVRTDGVQLVARWEKAGTKTLTMYLSQGSRRVAAASRGQDADPCRLRRPATPVGGGREAAGRRAAYRRQAVPDEAQVCLGRARRPQG